MKLNHDCVRACMLYLEENLGVNSRINLVGVHLKDYSYDDVLYSFIKLSEAGFINGKPQPAGNNPAYVFITTSITYEGHKFIDSVRDDKVWSATKKISSKVASVSLDILTTIATNVLTKMLIG